MFGACGCDWRQSVPRRGCCSQGILVLTRGAQASEEAEPDARFLELSRTRSWQSFLSQTDTFGNELGSGVLCCRMQMKQCLLLYF